jgi:Lantibiotic dehydratase, N terminus
MSRMAVDNGQRVRALQVPPAFVVRVAGLPMAVLGHLRFDQTMSQVNELLDRQDQLRVEGEELSQALYDVIGAVDDPALRGRLIALRRSAYQGQPPRRGVLDDDLWAVIPAELAARIAAWSRRITERDALRARAEATLEAESVGKRRALANAASDEWFQQGLILASQDLYAELVKWLHADPAARPDAQLEASLVKYVSRAATKTTPYSTFTSITEGRWAADGPPVRCVETWSRHSAVEIAMRIVLHLRRELARWPQIKPHLPLRVNPSLTEPGGAGGTLQFIGRRGGEAVVEMAATPTLRCVLEVIRATPDPSYAEAAAAIAAIDPTTCPAEITAYLDRLLDVGLLEVQLAVPDQSLDHLGALLDALARYTGDRLERIRELLKRLRAHLARLADGTQAHVRFEQVGAVNDTLYQLYTALGWTQRGIEVPRKKALFEDTLVVGLEYRCALPDWGDVLDDLRLLAGLAGLYDRFLPTRLALAAFFADHYGPGSTVSFLKFCRALCDEERRPARWRADHRVSGADLLAIRGQQSIMITAGLDALEQVKRLQQQIATHVRNQPVDQAGIRRLDRHLLGEFIAALPTFVHPHDSAAFYGQPMIRDGTPQFVLNNTDSGFRRAQSRLHRLAKRAHNGTPPSLRLPADNEGAVYADLAEIANSNLNLRTSPTPYEIIYPGSISQRPPTEQMPLGDLDVIHDPATDRLRLVWRSCGQQVLPLHMGMMVDWALPWAYRLLIQTFGVSSFAALPRRLSGLDSIADDGRVTWTPRLCLGNVIIQRAAWVVRAGDVPLSAKGESALSYLLRVTRWIREHSIPPQCFVSAISTGGATTIGKNRKPCYIDFSNQIFLRVFHQIAHPPDRMLAFQEILPTEDDLLVTDGSAAYASECVFELGR